MVHNTRLAVFNYRNTVVKIFKIMELLIRSAVILNPGSPFHLKKKDIYIQDGWIRKIDDHITPPDPGKVHIIKEDNLHVSAGWFDLKANFRDPGFEQKEDFDSGIAAAAAGGFTGVLLMPSTQPVVQNKAAVEYLVNKGQGKAVDVFPSGTLTRERDGKELTEMYDMKLSGALAFTDDKRTITDTGLMQRALLYGKQVNSLLIVFAEDKALSGTALVNESLHTTRLGLKGVPAIAEELIVARDISLCEYTAGRIHFSLISTAGSVKLIREARKKGLLITADVSFYHLDLDDSLLQTFDTNFKTKPPLRSSHDKMELIKGLQDGTIDAIVSDHSPEDEENKKVEFDFAAFGMIGLETAFAVANTVLSDKMKLEQIIEKFTSSRVIAGLNPITIRENEKANLTLFNPVYEWIFEESSIKSKSRNTPYLGKKLTGKVTGIINNGMFL